MNTFQCTPVILLVFCSIHSAVSQTTPSSLEPGDAAFRLNPDKSNWFAYKNNDEAQLSQTQIASADNTVQGVYQYKHPETGPTRTEYTAGERGFRARGTDIARQMDLSQNKIPYNPPVSPNSPNYNPTYDGYHDPNEDPSYKFKIRTPTFVKDEVAGSQGQVQGSYTYTDDIGEVHRVDYEAGAGKGFRVKNPVPDNAQSGFYFGGPGIPPRGRTSVQQGEDGSYTFVAQGPNLRRAEKRDNQGRVAGSYSYIDDKGAEKTVSYIAGPETGYQIVDKVPKEFIPLFQPGFFPSVTPVIPFPTNFPKFPTSAFPDINGNKIPSTTFPPLFPSSTTTFRPPSFPSPKPSTPGSDGFDDIFGSSKPTQGSFPFVSTTSSSPGGIFSANNNQNNNGNKAPNGFTPTTVFPTSSSSGQGKPDGFLNPQSSIFNPSGGGSGGFGSGSGFGLGGGSGGLGSGGVSGGLGSGGGSGGLSSGGGSGGLGSGSSSGGFSSGSGSSGGFGSGDGSGGFGAGGSSSKRPGTSSSSGSGNDFLTGPNFNSVSNQIPVISFPVENPYNKPGDYSNICKVCKSLRDKNDPEFFNNNNQGFRPTYNTYHENHNNGGDEFNGFPHGVAVRAHVQSIDLYPFGSRVPEPGEAIDSIERIDRSSPEIFEREILYTTPSTNLISSLHSARANSIKNEYDKRKSDRIVVPKIDYKEEKENGKIVESPVIEASTYRGILGKEVNPEPNKSNNVPDIFKNFDLFGNLTKNSQKNTISEQNKNFNDNYDSLFQAPQNNQAQAVNTGTQNLAGFIQNANGQSAKYQSVSFENNVNNRFNSNKGSESENYNKNENVSPKQKSKSQNTKMVGPNLLELLQKEVRSRPIYVPDLPDESNNFSSSPNLQAQARSSANPSFSPFILETSSTAFPETKERNPPRGRKRGSSRFSRTSNTENQRKKERKSQ